MGTSGTKSSATKLIKDVPVEDSGALYPFQQEAVDWFCDSNGVDGVGIFEMATGSGKTFTSLACVRKMFDEKRIDRALVVVPNILLSQWEKEIRGSPDWLLGIGGNGMLERLWEFSRREKTHLKFKNSKRKSLMLVSFTMFIPLLKMMSKWSSEFLSRTLVVLDEVHNVGSDRFRKLEIQEL